MKSRESVSKYRSFIMIFIIAFFVYCSNTMINTTISKYADHLGATSAVVGMVSGSFAMMALVMRPFSGQAVDNLNKKHLLSISMSMILFSTVGLMFSDQVYQLIIFRGLNGFGWGIGSTLCMTIATNVFPKDKMTTGIGIYTMGQTIAQATAPSIALAIVAANSFNYLYQFNVVLMVVALILSFYIKLDDNDKKEKFLFSFDIRKMIAIPAIMPAVLTLCNNLARSSITAFLVLYADSLNIVNIGYYFTIQALTLLISRPIVSFLADRFGINKILIPCEIIQMLALFILFMAKSSLYFVIAAFLMGLATAGIQPTLMGLCVNSVPLSQRGIASNTSYVGTDIGAFIGSNISGIIAGYFGYRRMYLIAIIPVLLSLVAYLFYIRSHPKLTSIKNS